MARPKPLNETLAASPPGEADYAYLAGIMDGEGSFVALTNTNNFGIQVAITDEALALHLKNVFGGKVWGGGTTSVGNAIFRWNLTRQADLKMVLPRLLPYLVIKGDQARAMIKLIEHLQAQPDYSDAPTYTVTRRERDHRRATRAMRKQEELALRAAVSAARPKPKPHEPGPGQRLLASIRQ